MNARANICPLELSIQGAISVRSYEDGTVIGEVRNVLRFASQMDAVLNVVFSVCMPLVLRAKQSCAPINGLGRSNHVGMDMGKKPGLYFEFFAPHQVVDAAETEARLRAVALRFVRTEVERLEKLPIKRNKNAK